MKLLSAIVLSVLLCACSTLKEHEPTVQLVTQYAVVKYAERLPPETRAERVQRIREIAIQIKALAAEETSLALLKDAVAIELNRSGLSPADRLLADGLVQLIVAELQRRIGDGLLSAEQRVQVAQVMDWIITATQLA